MNDLPPSPQSEADAPQSARVSLSFDVPAGTVVRLQISARGKSPQVQVEQAEQASPSISSHIARPSKIFPPWLRQRLRPTATWALALALLLYALTRLIGLSDFPGYFSCDESISGTWAQSLLQNGLRDRTTNEFLPTFLKNDGQYSLSATVYLLLLPVKLFGTSVGLVRGFTALLSVLMAWWLIRIGRDFLHLRLPWLSVLLLACIPTWFLHSRTGLEAPQMVSFYTGFLYYYLRYRQGHGRSLWVALLLGVLTFYTYTPGQIIMVFSGVVLLLLDARYHWQQRRVAAVGLGILIVAALPLLRFWILHPTAYAERMVMYGSYLAQADLNFWQKLIRYLGQYFAGLEPGFWFLPNPPDHVKYRMGPYPNIPWPYLPLIGLGLWHSIRHWREPALRLLWLALLASPTGAALVNAPSIPRLLLIVVPLTLLAALGLQMLLNFLGRLRWPPPWLLELATFCLLGLSSLLLLQNSLRTGSLWSHEYGIDGVQWGAPQVFAQANRYVEENPNRSVAISPNWTFQGEQMRQFFLPNQPNVRIEAIEPYIYTLAPDILENTSFLLTAEDLQKVEESGHFAPPQIEGQIAYPNDQPGFFLVRLHYVDNIDQILQAEFDLRHQLVPASWQIDALTVTGQVSQLDGDIQNIFDGNPETLTRTAGVNPFVLEITFPEVQALRGVQVHVGAEAMRLNARVTTDPPQDDTLFILTAAKSDGFKDLTLDFEKVLNVQSMRLELLDLSAGDPSPVHIWEITLLR
jgi:4-amino-4-deoxy-L-arabinose transferase-like glycosyltransferase